MRATFARLGLRLFTAALAAVLSLVVIGLYVADRALTQASRNHAQLDAVEAAALIESFLAVQAQALNAFRGLYLDSLSPANGDRFTTLASTLAEYLPAFRRVWVTDSAGVVTRDFVIGPASPPLAAFDLDTLPSLDMAVISLRARRTGRTQTSGPGRLFGGEPGFALLQPIFFGRKFAGFVGASVTWDAVLANVTPRHEREGVRLRLIAGRDTVMRRGDPAPTARMDRAHALVLTPGGDRWRVEVEHTAIATLRMRVALWAIGLATLAVLLIVVLRERRAVVRTAERSRELERLSAELLRANRMKSEFLANISHELRTPLNAIVGFVDLLRDGVYGELNARQVGPVDRIAASANHLRHLVDQVLDIAKMAAGRLEVHIEPVDLRLFVLDVASDIESLLTEKGLSLSIAVGASLPRLRTDPAHLRQILVNLVGNAVKYTETGGVAVRARLLNAPGGREGERRYTPESSALVRQMPRAGHPWIALQVIDTGIGIVGEDQERIFDEFEQVNAGPRGDSMRRGTGLGLPISRRLARLLGGDVTVESVLGRGSTFTLWLPVHPADVRVEITGEQTPVVRVSVSGGRGS
jgi:signal transduction histidine kinase